MNTFLTLNSRPVSFKFMTKFLEENKNKSEILIEEERKNERIEEQRVTEGRAKIERGGEQWSGGGFGEIL